MELISIIQRPIKELIEAEYNPRKISKKQFKQLKTSLEKFGFIDPVLVNMHPVRKNVIVGGHMRTKAASALGYKEVPCIELNLTLEQEKELNVRLNKSGGSFDMDALANFFEPGDLLDWGFEEVELGLKEEETPATAEQEENKEDALLKKWVPDCLYPSNNEYDIPTLLPVFPDASLPVPFVPYGWQSRDSKHAGTYHFYVDDYRFEAIWDNPNKILDSTCLAVVEPNLSLFNETPISYGLHLIYKKRWIARYFQQYNIAVVVDLNVAPKFTEYNLLGVPEGYNAFCTRGYENRIESLEHEYSLAQRVSGKAQPFFVVYGGGKKVRSFCAANNCVFMNQIMNTKTTY